jgi:hypothetical protein
VLTDQRSGAKAVLAARIEAKEDAVNRCHGE